MCPRRTTKRSPVDTKPSPAVPGPAAPVLVQPGVYLFKLTPTLWDTHQLPDGVYRVTVTAWDTAGNHSSACQVIQVHNRASWLEG